MKISALGEAEKMYLGDSTTIKPPSPPPRRLPAPRAPPAVNYSESAFGYGMTKSSAASSLVHQTAKM